MDLKIGNFEIKSLDLETDFATGIVMNKSIAYDGSDLKFVEENVVKYREPFKVVNNKFTIQAKDTGGIALFEVDLKKGKFVFIENCGTVKPIELKQYKKIPIVE